MAAAKFCRLRLGGDGQAAHKPQIRAKRISVISTIRFKVAWFFRLAGALVGAIALQANSAPSAVLDEPIGPLPHPQQLRMDERKVKLGEKLFRDPRLSKDNTLSCVSCHSFDKGGADGRRFSVGFRGQQNATNAPTVFNSGFNFRQLWNGRAASLEAQIDGVIQNNKVLATTWPEIVSKLSQENELVQEFKSIYPDGIQAKNVMDAIATFERSLVTPSRFDRYLLGEANAITQEEKAGYQLFKNYGCVACHQGINVGGNMFQVFGVMGDYFKARGNVTDADLGRFNVTQRESDRHVFKVPSLRNVALTAPYFHDGSAGSLEVAVEVMFRYQLGRPAPEQDKKLIVRFLNSLTGETLEAKQ